MRRNDQINESCFLDPKGSKLWGRRDLAALIYGQPLHAILPVLCCLPPNFLSHFSSPKTSIQILPAKRITANILIVSIPSTYFCPMRHLPHHTSQHTFIYNFFVHYNASIQARPRLRLVLF